MRKLLTIFFVLLSFAGISQPVTGRSSSVVTVKDERWMAGKNMVAPVYADTVAANVEIGIDSCGALIFTRDYNGFWFRACSPKRWIQILPSGSSTADTLAWRIGGNSLASVVNPPYLGTKEFKELIFITDNAERLVIPPGGIERGSSPQTKILYIDTVTKQLSYDDINQYVYVDSITIGYASNCFDTLKEWRNGSFTVRGTIQKKNGLADGGIVTNVDTTTYNISPAIYNIACQTYETGVLVVTLNPNTDTLPRIDVIGVNNFSTGFVIQGIPAANPQVPSVDPTTQLGLVTVYFPANSDTATVVNIYNTTVYNTQDSAAFHTLTQLNDTTAIWCDLQGRCDTLIVRNTENWATLQNLSDSISYVKTLIPAQFNPIAGSNISLSGTYPNITISASGSGSTPGLNAVMAIDSATSKTLQSTRPIISTDSVRAMNADFQGLNVGDTVMSNKTLLFYGDSWTVGTGASPSTNRYSTLVTSSLRAVESNRGISSTRLVQTASGDSSFQNRIYGVPNYTSSIGFIFVAYGINDCRVGVGVSTYSTVLSAMIDTLITNRSYPRDRIVIVTPGYMGANGSPSRNVDSIRLYANAAVSVARSKNVTYVDVLNFMIDNGGPAIMDADSVHPNNTGHYIVSQAINLRIGHALKVYGPANFSNSVAVSGDVTIAGKLNMTTAQQNTTGELNWGNSVNGNKVVVQEGGSTSTRAGLGYRTSTGACVLFGRGSLSGSVMAGSGQDATTMTTANSAWYLDASNRLNVNGASFFTGDITSSTGMIVTSGNIEATNGILRARGSNATLSLYDRTSNTNQTQFLLTSGTNLNMGASNLTSFAAPINADIQFNNVNIGSGALPSARFEVGQRSVGWGTVSVSAGGTTVTGTNTQFTNAFKEGDQITFTTSSGSETKRITAIGSNTSMTTEAFTGSASSVAYNQPSGVRMSVFGNGNVLVGTTTQVQSSAFTVASTTQAARPFPSMTSAQRDAMPATQVAGNTIYCSDCTATDTSTGVVQTYNGSTWKNLW